MNSWTSNECRNFWFIKCSQPFSSAELRVPKLLFSYSSSSWNFDMRMSFLFQFSIIVSIYCTEFS